MAGIAFRTSWIANSIKQSLTSSIGGVNDLELLEQQQTAYNGSCILLTEEGF